MDKFLNRQDAGIALAAHLKAYANRPNVIALALPRGGVPVAYEVATALTIPLDIMIVRKLGVPGHAELAMGAIASGGTVIFNEPLIQQLHLNQASIDAVLQAEQQELERREHLYRGNRRFPELLGKTVILIDDGIATGSTMHAAVKALRKHKPATILIAVPVAPRLQAKDMGTLVDKLICVQDAVNFNAVGNWYEDFTQVADSEVTELLAKANSPPPYQA